MLNVMGYRRTLDRVDGVCHSSQRVLREEVVVQSLVAAHTAHTLLHWNQRPKLSIPTWITGSTVSVLKKKKQESRR